MGGKAKPKKHTAAELAAKAKAATESVGGGKAGIAERDKTANLKTECQEPGCAGIKLASLTVFKTHWSTKHCTCRMTIEMCTCFPKDKYEPLFCKVEKVATHHNQASCRPPTRRAIFPFPAHRELSTPLTSSHHKPELLSLPPNLVAPPRRAQAATLASNKNASKAVRDKLKAQQAAAAIVDAARQGGKTFTAKAAGPTTL